MPTKHLPAPGSDLPDDDEQAHEDEKAEPAGKIPPGPRKNTDEFVTPRRGPRP